MKILLIHNHYQRFGGEHVAVALQEALLKEMGHEVISYTRSNADTETYGLWQKLAFFPQTIYSKKTYRDIMALADQEKPDVAHIHNVFPLISPSVYRALKDAKVPMVQTLHNFRFLCPNAIFFYAGEICERCQCGNMLPGVKRGCFRQSRVLSGIYAATIALHRAWGTFRSIDRFIALTEFTARKLMETGFVTQDKITVLGNFLPDPLPVPGSMQSREPYALYLGRLSTEKGVTVLIEAMRGLPDLGLKLLGVGPQEDFLKGLAAKVNPHIEFLGHLDGEAKWDLLRRATVTVVPSLWYETFCLVALESLAVGTPVVASDLGSLPHVVENGQSGLLFRPGDAGDLRQKLAWLRSHSEEALALGTYGRQAVEANYSSRSHYRRLMQIYEEIVR